MAQDTTPNLQRFTAHIGTTERVATINATGDLVTDKDVIIAFLSDATAISLLTDTGNWDSSGAYIGTGITGTYAGQYYYDDDYYFFAVGDNTWIRISIYKCYQFNLITGTEYTLTTSDHNKIVEISGSTSFVLYLPTGMTEGFNCKIMKLFSGDTITFTAGYGISNIYSEDDYVILSKQYGFVEVIYRGNNIYYIKGSLNSS